MGQGARWTEKLLQSVSRRRKGKGAKTVTDTNMPHFFP